MSVWPAGASEPIDGSKGVVQGHSLLPSDVVSTDRLNVIGAMPQPQPSKLVIPGFVTIHADGTVEIPEGVTPNEAAEAFWNAVKEMRPW